MRTENGLKLPWEIVDAITLENLRESLKYLQKEITDHIELGEYLHPDDLIYNQEKLIPALETIIDYFNGDLE